MLDSVRVQLTLWYTAVLAFVLVVLSLITYFIFWRSTVQRTDATSQRSRWFQQRAGGNECDADAERRHEQVRLGIVLRRLIPVIKQLEHRRTQAGAEDHRGGEAPHRSGHNQYSKLP